MKKIFIALCIIYTILSFLWHSIPQGLGKLLLIPIGMSVLSVLGFYIKAVIYSDLNKYKVKHKQEVAKQEKDTRKKQKDEFLREYDVKIKPLYFKTKLLFTQLLQQRKMHSYEIEDFKALLNNRLGKHLDYYHNYKYKNDAQEIYTKFKNFNLNEYDWELLYNYLKSLENNEPISKKKKEEVS